MRASYSFQLVNLLASAALLLMALAALDDAGYLQWVLFSTIAGLLIQAESSLSAIATRYISRARASRADGALAAALRTVGRLYRRLATAAALTMFVAGGLYLASADNGRFLDRWPLEWGIFCAAYLSYYVMANNACSLIAMERLQSYAWIGVTSRVLNVALTGVLLLAGLKVLGLSISVLVSFLVGATLYYAKARDIVPRAERGTDAARDAVVPFAFHHVGLHALYVLAAYVAYRYGLLLDASVHADTAAQASYGLALQMFALIVTVASVPVTMRVAPLVRVVEERDTAAVLDEVARLGAYVNAVFVVVAGGFVLASGLVSAVLPSRGAVLPSMAELAALAGAFWVEVNIAVFVNALLAARDFRFCATYYASLGLAWALGTGLWVAGVPFFIAFVLVPMAVQLTVAAQFIFRMAARRFEFGLADYARQVAHQLESIVSNPRALLLRAKAGAENG